MVCGYLVPRSNIISPAKAKIHFISCDDLGDIGIKARDTVYLFDLCSTSCGHNISIVVFFGTTRVVIELISPPASTGFGGHAKRGMYPSGLSPTHFITISLEGTARKLPTSTAVVQT